MEEIWKDIEGYEGLYQVSNLGNVRSVYRIDRLGRVKRGKSLRKHNVYNGYIQVALSKNGVKSYKLVHRLVAQAFIHNPDNLPVINHKDEDPSNNRADNLEWCTQKYNVNYGTGIERRAKLCVGANKNSKAINQYTLSGEFVTTWTYLGEIKNTLGYRISNICACCNGRQKNAYGFQWRFASECDGASPIEPYNEPLKKKVLQYTLDGEFVREWPSLKSIQKELGFASGNICKHIQGQFKQAYKFIWRYASDVS